MMLILTVNGVADDCQQRLNGRKLRAVLMGAYILGEKKVHLVTLQIFLTVDLNFQEIFLIFRLSIIMLIVQAHMGH